VSIVVLVFIIELGLDIMYIIFSSMVFIVPVCNVELD